MSRVHHSAICAKDVDASLRFYRDGLGMDVLQDHEFVGAWRELFGARTDRLRSVFLGDAQRPEAGVVELVVFEGGVDDGPGAGSPATGFFLLSLFTDVEATLARLGSLGLGGEPSRIDVPGPDGAVRMATVHDPDGVLVELIDTGG